MKKYTYDTIVVGSGAAGYNALVRIKEGGGDVALVCNNVLALQHKRLQLVLVAECFLEVHRSLSSLRLCHHHTARRPARH